MADESQPVVTGDLPVPDPASQQAVPTRLGPEVATPVGKTSGYAPGFIFYAVTLALALGALVLDAEASLPAILLSLLLCVGLTGLAIGWFILGAVAVKRTHLRIGLRAWARGLCIPVIVALCFELLATSAPLRLRFELSRTAFQQAASRVQAGQVVDGGNIGLFQIDRVLELPNGVWFEDLSLGFIDPCGLAYSPSGRPEITRLGTDLGGGWWIACEDF
ncbi:MAG TPA: hypothetical protein VF337_06915 [Candidatus Limnocylindrales bacterium]